MPYVHRAGTLVLVLGTLLAGACRAKSGAPAPHEPQMVLEVRNNSLFDVVIYAMPYSTNGPFRLGTIGSFSARQLAVPPNALRMGGILVLRLHAIGSRYQWTTPELSVATDLKACLDITADYRGELSRSSFYTVLNPDTTGVLVAPRGACGLPATSGGN
jgi:hypothetical protein